MGNCVDNVHSRKQEAQIETRIQMIDEENLPQETEFKQVQYADT